MTRCKFSVTASELIWDSVLPAVLARWTQNLFCFISTIPKLSTILCDITDKDLPAGHMQHWKLWQVANCYKCDIWHENRIFFVSYSTFLLYQNVNIFCDKFWTSTTMPINLFLNKQYEVSPYWCMFLLNEYLRSMGNRYKFVMNIL